MGKPYLVLCLLLVQFSRCIVLVFVNLVTDGILGSFSTGTERSVGVLGNFLVGFLGGGGGGFLDGVRDVVAIKRKRERMNQ